MHLHLVPLSCSPHVQHQVVHLLRISQYRESANTQIFYGFCRYETLLVTFEYVYMKIQGETKIIFKRSNMRVFPELRFLHRKFLFILFSPRNCTFSRM